MADAKKFDWVDFYTEFAGILRQYEDKAKRMDLVDKVKKILRKVKEIDKTLHPFGKNFREDQFTDVDPFSVFQLLNGTEHLDKRKKIFSFINKIFEMKAPVPNSFDGIPTYSRAPFYQNFIVKSDNPKANIDIIWNLFESALTYSENPSQDNQDSFSTCFNARKAINVLKKTGTVTMCLYWIAPKTFPCLDENSLNYISNKFPAEYKDNFPEITEKKGKYSLKAELTAELYFGAIKIINNYLKSDKSESNNFMKLSDDTYWYCHPKEEKDKTKSDAQPEEKEHEKVGDNMNYKNKYSPILVASKNIIFHGAPGTGKTYLAKEIAADIISDGSTDNYEDLSAEQKDQMEFVQFHPSYDYTDFVEGLRPKTNNDGSMTFELEDGVFKKFVSRARTNYENSKKAKETIKKEASVDQKIDSFLSNVTLGTDTFEIMQGTKFHITDFDDKYIYIFIPENQVSNQIKLNKDELRKMMESGDKFSTPTDVTKFFGKIHGTQQFSYDLALFKKIKDQKSDSQAPSDEKEDEKVELKNYVFIIDEINRGEISKILGELFFSIDPGYRGEKGAVSTQYANLHPNEKFFIPDNVYIIGTMNDIDRSVDTFDFAMRRRFRFIKLKANENLGMLDALDKDDLNLSEEAINRMGNLNNAIAGLEDLNEDYQIGAAYFLKLKELKKQDDSKSAFDQLWTDYLQPLLQDYIQGMADEKGIMDDLKKAYDKEAYKNTDKPASNEGNANESDDKADDK